MKANLHTQMDPAELYLKREVYHDNFDLGVFRKHFYQAMDAKPKRQYRFEKKKKAMKKSFGMKDMKLPSEILP